MIDTNVSLMRWPFRRLPLDETDRLVTHLRRLGVREAWAGSFDGVLHRDMRSVNDRLAEACSHHPELVPIGTINLELPSWQDDLRRCVDHHEMPGLRLYPGYHGQMLGDPRVRRLIELATSVQRFVQIVALLEDPRTQHPQLQVANVNLEPLPEVVREIPGARVQILNERPTPKIIELLRTTPRLYLDTARIDGTDGVSRIATALPDRVMLGTHAPFLIPEAALLRVHESGTLTQPQRRDVFENTARRFGRTRS